MSNWSIDSVSVGCREHSVVVCAVVVVYFRIACTLYCVIGFIYVYYILCIVIGCWWIVYARHAARHYVMGDPKRPSVLVTGRLSLKSGHLKVTREW